MTETTYYVPSYLRPLSQIRTGNESGLDKKADDVERIVSSFKGIKFKQLDSVPAWKTIPLKTKEVEGVTVAEDWTTKVDGLEVSHPNRHWWIISRGVLGGDVVPLRTHADIFDFLLSLNLCTDDPVLFSQNPGQVAEGAFKIYDNALKFCDELSKGSFPLALLSANEIPEQIHITEEVPSVYRMVQQFRSMRIDSDEDMDIRIALHLYDDALTSTIWTSMTNFYYACENVLFSGNASASEKDDGISEISQISEEEARKWRRIVNRMKHPDKGDDIKGLLDEAELEVPSLREIRKATNVILIHSMSERTQNWNE